MALAFYESDDTTLLSDKAITSLSAGAASDSLTVHLWNSKGDAGAADLDNLALVLYTEDPDTSGSWLRSGAVPSDELWAEVRFTGQDTTGDSGQANYTSDWTKIGAYRVVAFPEIRGGNARKFQIRFRPPSTATTNSWKWRLGVLSAEHSFALPDGTDGSGIDTGLGDYGRSGIISGLTCAATGTPDDEVQVAAGRYFWQGIVYELDAQAVTLSQADGAASSLASGESYYATLSLDSSGIAATKGNKSSGTPAIPAVPAGDVYLKTVLVQYDAGGGAIDNADITGTTVYDWLLVQAGTGLEALVNPGRVVHAGTYRYWTTQASVTLTDNATNRLWQLSTGLYSATTTDTPPETTAFGPIADVITVSGSVTTVIDRRRYLPAPLDAGTPNTGVRAQEYGDARIHQTVLTVTDLALPAITGGAAEAEGVLLYTLPAGACVVESAYMSLALQQQDGNITADTPDVGLGTTIATGAVAVLGGTPAFENIVTGQTAADCDGTATVQTIADQVLVIETGDSHAIYFNVADTWAASGDAGALVSGTVTLNWRRME